MSDSHETKAAQARFAAFVEGTEPNERDWIAFLEFEEAAHNAASTARLTNMYDNEPGGDREFADLKLALTAMFFRVLPKVDLGVLIADAEGIGYALRYGVIEQKPTALDGIENTEAYQSLAQRGYDAEQADCDRREAAIIAKEDA
jgi:hypothetical protein